jgi:lipid-binding SYLF domain-containing protein
MRSPQAGAATLNGTITAYDGITLTLLTTDGRTLAVQLGNAQYAASIGFSPQVGQSVAVYGFSGNQGLFSAVTVTLDGQVYAFRDEAGRPLWAGGNGRGNGGQH